MTELQTAKHTGFCHGYFKNDGELDLLQRGWAGEISIYKKRNILPSSSPPALRHLHSFVQTATSGSQVVAFLHPNPCLGWLPFSRTAGWSGWSGEGRPGCTPRLFHDLGQVTALCHRLSNSRSGIRSQSLECVSGTQNGDSFAAVIK